MESLSPENVKRIAGFLDFKDMVNLSQTRQPFQADLKPLIRKAEVAMMTKLPKVVTTLTRALIHIQHVVDDGDNLEASVDCPGNNQHAFKKVWGGHV